MEEIDCSQFRTPLTNAHLCVPGKLYPTGTTRSVLLRDVCQNLRDHGFEAIIDRYKEEAEGCKTIQDLLVLASGYLHIEVLPSIDLANPDHIPADFAIMDKKDSWPMRDCYAGMGDLYNIYITETMSLFISRCGIGNIFTHQDIDLGFGYIYAHNETPYLKIVSPGVHFYHAIQWTFKTMIDNDLFMPGNESKFNNVRVTGPEMTDKVDEKMRKLAYLGFKQARGKHPQFGVNWVSSDDLIKAIPCGGF